MKEGVGPAQVVMHASAGKQEANSNEKFKYLSHNRLQLTDINSVFTVISRENNNKTEKGEHKEPNIRQLWQKLEDAHFACPSLSTGSKET